MARVLICEGANGHGECLPSYYSYFKELGYDVDFVIKSGVAKESPLWMLKDINTKIYTIENHLFTNYRLNFPHFNEMIEKVENLTSYDLYFIGTFNPEAYTYVKFFASKGITKDKILFQQHLNYEKYLKESQNDVSLGQNGFTLGMADHEYFPQLAPSKNITPLTHSLLTSNISDKNKLVLFISGLSHVHFKNFELLVKAAEELQAKGKNIEINLTGIREQGNYILPNSPVLHYLGRINFEKMAYYYTTCDFLFVLFDVCALQDQNEHNTFLAGRVSGSRNMSITYKIPLVVQKAFQTAWGLNDSNSIAYEGHDYKSILLQLYNFKQTKYNSIIKALGNKEKEEFSIGLDNLKMKIDALKTNHYDNEVVAPIKKKKTDFILF